ncbi:MAG: ABC transporter permease, partial [Psychrilyobacter sp.]|nr:ABC transporter permease [Psychrilyobacter sp.]
MKSQKYGLIYSTPITLWLTLLFVAPTLIVIVYSFLKKGLYGGVEWIFSSKGYNFFTSSYFLKILWNTIEVSLIVTGITLLIAIPVALYIATSKNKNFLLFLIIIPFWTNFLIRIYSWIALLGNNGILNNLLLKIGLEPHQFIYNKFAVILVSVYAYLPYAILPLYSAIEK